MIDVEVAQSIVTRMKNIIHQELNFFSIEGTIIASTDPSRIGQANHEGAKLVLKSNKPLIIEFNEQYKGAKQGINLPVSIDNQIVGVIGITGAKEEVSQYGEIIKQMTEVLILNNSARELIFNRRNMFQNILDYITRNDNVDGLSVELIYGIKFDKSRIALVASPSNFENNILIDELSSIFVELYFLLGSNNQHIFDIRGNMIILLLQTDSEEYALQTAETINNLFIQKFNLELRFGIGNFAEKKEDINTSILLAKSALHWNQISQKSMILKYSDMEYGVVLNSVTRQNKILFLNKIFQNLSIEEIDDIIELIETYEEANGSIKVCSEKLFIHKNTVQYKLNKIEELTGYNPRNISDFFILKLASILYQTVN